MATAPQPSTEIKGFSLPASTGQTLSLDSFKGKVPLVLVFLNLEHDGETALLSELNARHKDFGSERAQVLAIVKMTARQTRETAEKMGLSVPLLADASGAMTRAFDVDDGAGNSVAVVADRQGRLVRRFDPLPLDDDPSAVADAFLHAVRAIGSGALEDKQD